MLSADQIVAIIQDSIRNWHVENENRQSDYVIVTDEIKKIRPLNSHRDDMGIVVQELVKTNTEMWHEEDKVRSENDAVVLKAIRNINPLNRHRNHLIEEIDEIILEQISQNKHIG